MMTMPRALGLAALLIGCSTPAPPPAQVSAPESAVRVRAVRVRRERLAVGSVLVGTLAPWNRAVLAARVPGDLERLAVERGDRVRRGQVLGHVRVPGIRQQVSAALAARHAAEAELAAQQDLAARAHRVAETNAAAIAAQEVLAATHGATTARARVRSAGAEAARVSALAADTRIVAPFDGVVVARLADAGTSVSPGTRLVELAQVDPLRLVVDVPEGELAFVRVGARVTATLPALGNRTLPAAVARYAPALDPATRSLRIEVDLANEGSLFAGLEARVRFLDAVRQDAVLLPADAIQPEREATVVYLLQGDRARRVLVRVGYDDGARVEVLEGLAGTEEVLLGGRGLLQDGARVEVAR